MPIRGMDKVKKALNESSDRLNSDLREVYMWGLGEIVDVAPVHFKDGGRLKNNFFLTQKTPSSRTTDTASEAGSNSHSQITKMPKDVLNKTIYFTNNLPYANLVEYGGYPLKRVQGGGTYIGNGKRQYLSQGGYSQQAPEGMVRVNIKRMQARIRKL